MEIFTGMLPFVEKLSRTFMPGYFDWAWATAHYEVHCDPDFGLHIAANSDPETEFRKSARETFHDSDLIFTDGSVSESLPRAGCSFLCLQSPGVSSYTSKLFCYL